MGESAERVAAAGEKVADAGWAFPLGASVPEVK
jgi:hypothetical protein